MNQLMKKLVHLTPQTTRLIEDGTEKIVPAEVDPNHFYKNCCSCDSSPDQSVRRHRQSSRILPDFLQPEIYYMNIDLYQYYIGRADQSVNEKMLIKRLDQYVRVVYHIMEGTDLGEVHEKHPKLANYLGLFLTLMVGTVSIHLIRLFDHLRTALQPEQSHVDAQVIIAVLSIMLLS